MSILNVGSEYPPGYTGDPYTALDISIFYDMNWPDHAGIRAQGFPAYSSGLGGLGQCSDIDPDTGLCLDSSTIPTPAPVVCPAGQVDNGGGICIPTAPTTTPNYTCSSVALSSMSAQDMFNCGYTTTLGGPLVNAPLNTALTPAQAGLTPAQQAALITATGNSAVSLIRTAAGGPYTVAGTNLVYNPATGALTTATALNATASLTAGLSAITPYIPLILIAIAAVVILPSVMGKK
jgi:hypothetical protein